MPEGMIVIRYLDHVLFRGVDHREQRPIVRETVGWLVRQSEMQCGSSGTVTQAKSRL